MKYGIIFIKKNSCRGKAKEYDKDEPHVEFPKIIQRALSNR